MRRILLLTCALAALPAFLHAAEPGPFAQGSRRVGVYGGLGSSLGQDYGILGGGVGYFVADGLEAGVDGEAWFGNSPGIQKVTPQLRYVVWQSERIKPYLGAFWRRTFTGGGWPDWSSWGGRAGVAYRQGGSYLAVGVVHERYLDTEGITFADDSQTYPEVAFWLSF